MAGSTYIFCMYLLFVSLCKRLILDGFECMGMIFFDSGSFIQRDGWLKRSYALYFVEYRCRLLTSYFIIILMFIVILIWLVAWNMFYFSIYWEYLGISSSQVTFIFFKWVKTTNQSSILIILYPLVN